MEFEFKSNTQVIARFNSNKNISLILELAITTDEKIKGLSNRTNLLPNYGMIFIFRPKERVNLWMKDTLISLDLIFLDSGKVINIVKNTIPDQVDTKYDSGAEISEVIEANTGFIEKNGIKIGDKVSFERVVLFK